MFFRVILFVWDFVLDLVAISRMTNDDKDLEILLLRQQLRIVEKKQERGPQIPRWQKVPLVALVLRLKQKTSHSRHALENSPIVHSGWPLAGDATVNAPQRCLGGPAAAGSDPLW